MDSPRGVLRSRRGVILAVALTLAVIIATLLHKPFSSTKLDGIPRRERGTHSLEHFEGRDCGITPQSLYPHPHTPDTSSDASLPFCPTRAALLTALSGGGRPGFTAPYHTTPCAYRWYSTPEICMILDRFDGVVFLGDSPLQTVYAGLNILLRENFALGALSQWDLSDADRSTCRCSAQFINPTCLASTLLSSTAHLAHDASSPHSSPYVCARIPHIHIPLSSSPPPPTSLAALTTFLTTPSPSSYKPIPVITSLSLAASFSWPATLAFMDTLADHLASPAIPAARTYPLLWLGPNAPGHLKPSGKILAEGHSATWHFTTEMGREARSRGWDSLGMYNMTLQAGSWDGTMYGLDVAVVQAMMVVNWLARVEST